MLARPKPTQILRYIPVRCHPRGDLKMMKIPILKKKNLYTIRRCSRRRGKKRVISRLVMSDNHIPIIYYFYYTLS